MKFNWFDWIVMILIIVGGLNWGLIGFFNYDLVASLFGAGDMEEIVPRVIYAVVGLAALYAVFGILPKGSRGK